MPPRAMVRRLGHAPDSKHPVLGVPVLRDDSLALNRRAILSSLVCSENHGAGRSDHGELEQLVRTMSGLEDGLHPEHGLRGHVRETIAAVERFGQEALATRTRRARAGTR